MSDFDDFVNQSLAQATARQQQQQAAHGQLQQQREELHKGKLKLANEIVLPVLTDAERALSKKGIPAGSSVDDSDPTQLVIQFHVQKGMTHTLKITVLAPDRIRLDRPAAGGITYAAPDTFEVGHKSVFVDKIQAFLKPILGA